MTPVPSSSPSPGGPGLSPHIAATVAYLGGIITGVIILIVERHDRFVRFHAMQSTITFAGVLVVHLMLRGLGTIGAVAYIPFVIAVACLWIMLMVKAFQGQTYKLPYIGDFAEHQLK